MTLAKEDLIQTLYDQAGFSKQTARTTVETVFELVKKTLNPVRMSSSVGLGNSSSETRQSVEEEILKPGRI